MLDQPGLLCRLVPSHCYTGSGQCLHTKQPAVRAESSGAEARASEEALQLFESVVSQPPPPPRTSGCHVDLKESIPSLDKPPFP